MANKITYTDKIQVNPKKTHVNQFWADDANEIKAKHNLDSDRIDALAVAGAQTYQTLADLNAVSPVPDDGTPAKVANDPTGSNNGYYSVVSGAWVQDSPFLLSSDTTPQLGGDLDLDGNEINGKGNISISNGTNADATPTTVAMQFYNFAQQGLGSEPIGFVAHHYTDGNLMQLDNVGTGDILRLVNAQNATNRPDEASDYIGTGDFLKLITTIAGTGSQQTIMFIDENGYYNYPRTSDFYRITLNKTDSSDYAFQFMLSTDNIRIVNFDNKFLVQNENVDFNAFVSDRGYKFYTHNSINALALRDVRIDANLPVYFWDSGDNIVYGKFRFQDNAILKIGTGNDLQIAHNGTDTNFDLYNGDIVIRNNTTEQIRFERTTGKINAKDCNFSGLPTYADDTAAASLTAGDLYKTATGELRIKL